MRVAVQIPSFMEGTAVESTLDAWKRQTLADEHTASVQLWVTPASPAFEDDPTVQVAREYPDVTVHRAPPGKLTARNTAHDHAVSRGYDAIVTADADVVPADAHVLQAAVDALADPDVAAVNSRVRATGGVAGPVATAAGRVMDFLRPHMNGQLSGFTAEAWERAGPFDESVDQTEMSAVRSEEEFDFRRRLEHSGSVARPKGVRAIEGTRRIECHVQRSFARFGQPTDDYCSERGVSTFHWRR
jgi:hypothetical protein